MDRRDLLKGLFGGLAAVAVGSKVVLSKVDAAELNKVLPSIKSRTIRKIGDVSIEDIEYFPNPYMITSTTVIPPHKVPLEYEEGDIIEKFSVSADTRRALRPRIGDLVTLDSKDEVIYYDVAIEAVKKETGKWTNLSIGRVIALEKNCWTCTVLIRNRLGWVW